MSFIEEINVKITTDTGNLELDLAKTLLNVMAKENFWILLRAQGKMVLDKAEITYTNSVIDEKTLQVSDEDGHVFTINADKWQTESQTEVYSRTIQVVEENFDDI